MKIHLVAAALLAGVGFALPAIAADASAKTPAHVTTVQLPVPTTVVSPTDLPLWCANLRVEVELRIDEHGVPHDIKCVDYLPSEVRTQVVSALRQWRFSPARHDGHPIAQRAILPLVLSDDPAPTTAAIAESRRPTGAPTRAAASTARSNHPL